MNLDSSRSKAATRSARATRALRTQLREAVRGEIIDAAEELFAARGLQGASLVQIAKRAGIAVGTLYNYFADRDALVRAVFEARRTSLRPLLLAAAENAEALPFEQRLRLFMRDLLIAFETHRRFLKVAIEAEHVKVAPATTAQDLRTAIEQIVTAGVAERAIYKDDADLLPAMIAGAIKAVVIRRTAEGGAFVRDSDAIVSIFLDGVRRQR